MKATVQYNDFVGSAAADISDHFSLNDFLKERNVDTERYNAIGAEFYCGYSDFFSVYIICVDKDRSTDEKRYLVNIGFEKKITKDEFFDLFKRFNVVITQKYGKYESQEIEESIRFDDRGEEDDE